MNTSDQPCANHEYCKNVIWAREDAPSAVFCEPCEKLVDAILHKSGVPSECPICYTEKKTYWVFPGCTLGHAFCPDCLDILLIGEAYVCGSLCTYDAPTYDKQLKVKTSDSLRTQCGGNIMILPDHEAVVIRPNCPLCPYDSAK